MEEANKTPYSLQDKKIWVPGSKGMVSSAISRRLKRENVHVIETSRQDIDLMDKYKVDDFLQQNKPDVVFLAAAKVGGIYANDNLPAEFLFNNLAIQNNVINGAYNHNVEKLLFLGSSCVYPKDATSPIKESALLSGALEETNEWYAIAKIAGIKMCQAYRRQYGCNFIAAMPTNLYGPFDNFHDHYSHVPAALLSRFHHAKINKMKTVSVWGTGKPRREFMYVDDLADACVFLMKNYAQDELVNIGAGEDVTIREFANLIKDITQYEGDISYDLTKPDGVYRKVMDVSKLSGLGWMPSTSLFDGLSLYYEWFMNNQDKLKGVQW